MVKKNGSQGCNNPGLWCLECQASAWDLSLPSTCKTFRSVHGCTTKKKRLMENPLCIVLQQSLIHVETSILVVGIRNTTATCYGIRCFMGSSTPSCCPYRRSSLQILSYKLLSRVLSCKRKKKDSPSIKLKGAWRHAAFHRHLRRLSIGQRLSRMNISPVVCICTGLSPSFMSPVSQDPRTICHWGESQTRF